MPALFGRWLLGPLIEDPDPEPNSGRAPGAKIPEDAVSVGAVVRAVLTVGEAVSEFMETAVGDIPGPAEPGGRVPISPPLDEPLPVCEGPGLPLPPPFALPLFGR